MQKHIDTSIENIFSGHFFKTWLIGLIILLTHIAFQIGQPMVVRLFRWGKKCHREQRIPATYNFFPSIFNKICVAWTQLKTSRDFFFSMWYCCNGSSDKSSMLKLPMSQIYISTRRHQKSINSLSLSLSLSLSQISWKISLHFFP